MLLVEWCTESADRWTDLHVNGKRLIYIIWKFAQLNVQRDIRLIYTYTICEKVDVEGRL